MICRVLWGHWGALNQAWQGQGKHPGEGNANECYKRQAGFNEAITGRWRETLEEARTVSP